MFPLRVSDLFGRFRQRPQPSPPSAGTAIPASVLKRALDGNGFELHYQPIYELEAASLHGFEALLRLRGDDGRPIAPTAFLPVAEQSGLIADIGKWVVIEACRAAALWPGHLRVAVNLSPREVFDADLARMVHLSLDTTGLDARRLQLEVTETALAANAEEALCQLRRLKAAGAEIVLDDFGSGPSSLGNLWRFPFDRIKIDRSLVCRLTADTGPAFAAVGSIVAAGRVLGLGTTAVGVERIEQMEVLHGLEVDHVQGFYYGKPMPLQEAAPLLLKGCGVAERPVESADGAPVAAALAGAA